MTKRMHLRLDYLMDAANCSQRVKGLTHNFYAYPARFSPQFVKAAIEAFTNPGDIVLDPFVGGGTSAVESRANSRLFIGSDISELAVYIAKVKSSPLTLAQINLLKNSLPDLLSFVRSSKDPGETIPETRNLNSFEAEALVRKIMLAVEWVKNLDSQKLQDFGRCVVLRTGQIVINGQKNLPEPSVFDNTLIRVLTSMLDGAEEYRRTVVNADKSCPNFAGRHTRIFNTSAANLPYKLEGKLNINPKLIITSPPYPGVHVLYHRWQLLGGKETALPFFIANKSDGKGLSHYCMHARSSDNGDRYFSLIRETFDSMRELVQPDATVVQLVAFSKPEFQLERYLAVMEESGFASVQDKASLLAAHSGWQRSVPSRKWYTNLDSISKEKASKEYLLIHKPR